MRFIVVAVLILQTAFAAAQDIPEEKPYSNKNHFFIYWGWNRAWYTNSDISFSGNTYDFTLKDVAAKDRQSNFNLDPYLNPMQMTIPQTNFRIGYYFNDHWSITGGVDHMKYVMVQNQTVKISGEISGTETSYNNIYNNEDIELKEDFLIFEHTDGLNYVNFEARRKDELFSFRKISKANIDINLIEGAGVGFLFPRTNTTLLSNERNDEFHVAGYGFSTMAGLNVTFWKHFFIQSELKGGFINMPDVRTTKFKSDKAKQHFFFGQVNYVFGLQFGLGK